MVDEIQTFRIADYAVFVITILISVAIGVYYAFSGGRQRTISEYLVGSRAMKFLPVAISLLVSNESSVMMLGLPAEAYVYGIQWIFSAVGTCVCQLLSVFIIVPLMHPLKITSIYEYLQYRFNSTAVRLLGTVLGMLNNVWYMGIVLFGPAIALEPVTGFSKLGCMISMAAIAVVYTSIGGFKAVVWTDVFQSIVMYLGMLAILIKGTVSVGSPAKVWEVADKGGRMNFFNFDFDPTVRHTFWTLFFATILRATGTVFSQATVQRISSTKTQREAKWVLIIMAPCYLVSLSLACYEGIIAYAYYETKGCDPLASNKLSDPNQMIPLMVMDLFRSLPGMPGLFLASLFSASLSTLSTHLNSLSAVLLTDIIKPRFRNMTELQGTIILKVSVIIFGIIGVGNALLVSMVGGPLTQVTTSLMSAFGGPLTGLFLLGCFFPCANKKGALGGVVLSLILSAWMSLGQSFSTTLKKTPWLPPASTAMCTANVTSGDEYNVFNSTISFYKMYNEGFNHTYSTTAAIPADDGASGIDVMYSLSYLLFMPIAIIATLVFGVIISLATGGNKPGEVHPRYVISFFDRLCCYLPESVRQRLRCVDQGTFYDINDEDSPEAEALQDKNIIFMEGKRASPKEDGHMVNHASNI